MLKPTHADILNKPYAQIKDLKLYCPDDLENIKHNHKTTWQVFKAFNLKVYEQSPINFAKPHIENWCNGWEIRRHFFAYYKYDSYLGNAPIIALILNRQKLVICLTWHSYKAKVSNSSLQNFNAWIDKINWENYSEFYVWHSSVDYYGDFMSVREFDYDKVQLNQGEFYRLGKFIEKDDLNHYNNDTLIIWASDTLIKLSDVYKYCH